MQIRPIYLYAVKQSWAILMNNLWFYDIVVLIQFIISIGIKIVTA